MPNLESMKQIKKRLIQRRDELRAERGEIDRMRKVLHEPEVEMEEQAQKEMTDAELEERDELTRDELKLINDALVRIEAGVWGVCENCGRDIEKKRLDALPWAKTCVECARGGEESEYPVTMGGVVEPSAPYLPPGYRDMTDEELAGAVVEELRNDGRVELDDLEVEARDGVIVLSGSLPSNRKHEVLLEVVEDIMGLTALEDNTRVNRVGFQREGDAERPEGPTEEQTLLEGEPLKDDFWEAGEEGESVEPPDQMVPERDEK